MNGDTNVYANHFRITLHPFIDLMEHRRTIMIEKEWLGFVDSIKKSIIANPEQFLGKDLPAAALVSNAIDQIFKQYLAEQDLLASSINN